MRLFLFPMVLSTVVLTSALIAAIVGLGYVHVDIPSGWLFVAILVMPFVAFGQLLLLTVVFAVRKTRWPHLAKAGFVVGTGALAGSLLIAWFSLELGAACGLVAATCWIGLNYNSLSSRPAV